jgi:hypothetical protein
LLYILLHFYGGGGGGGLEFVGHALLCCPFCIFERCLDSNPESCLSHTSPYLSHPSPFQLSHPLYILYTHHLPRAGNRYCINPFSVTHHLYLMAAHLSLFLFIVPLTVKSRHLKNRARGRAKTLKIYKLHDARMESISTVVASLYKTN